MYLSPKTRGGVHIALPCVYVDLCVPCARVSVCESCCTVVCNDHGKTTQRKNMLSLSEEHGNQDRGITSSTLLHRRILVKGVEQVRISVRFGTGSGTLIIDQFTDGSQKPTTVAAVLFFIACLHAHAWVPIAPVEKDSTNKIILFAKIAHKRDEVLFRL